MKDRKDQLKTKDINDILIGVDVFMYTSSITAGISVTTKFNTMYNLFKANTCEIIDNVQMTFRCRNVDKIIYIVQ